jgi:hypothetical protein
MRASTPPPLPRKSWTARLLQVLGGLLISVGVLGLPISAITFLMVLARSYGTEHTDPVGFFIIVCGPALVILTGFGLLRCCSAMRMICLVVLSLLAFGMASLIAYGSRLVKSEPKAADMLDMRHQPIPPPP